MLFTGESFYFTLSPPIVRGRIEVRVKNFLSRNFRINSKKIFTATCPAGDILHFAYAELAEASEATNQLYCADRKSVSGDALSDSRSDVLIMPAFRPVI